MKNIKKIVFIVDFSKKIVFICTIVKNNTNFLKK